MFAVGVGAFGQWEEALLGKFPWERLERRWLEKEPREERGRLRVALGLRSILRARSC